MSPTPTQPNPTQPNPTRPNPPAHPPHPPTGSLMPRLVAVRSRNGRVQDVALPGPLCNGLEFVNSELWIATSAGFFSMPASVSVTVSYTFSRTRHPLANAPRSWGSRVLTLQRPASIRNEQQPSWTCRACRRRRRSPPCLPIRALPWPSPRARSCCAMKVGVVVVCGTAPIDGSAPNRIWFPLRPTDYGVVLTPMQLDVRPIVPREVCNWMYPARSFGTARAPALCPRPLGPPQPAPDLFSDAPRPQRSSLATSSSLGTTTSRSTPSLR